MILYTKVQKNRSGPYLLVRAVPVVCEQRGKRESREEVGLSFLPDMFIIHDRSPSLVNGL